MTGRYILAVVLAGIFAPFCFAADLYVTPGQSIQAAIYAAVYGDTVHVAAGTYTGNIMLKNGVALVGAGPDTTTINGNDSGTVVRSENCDPNTILEGFTITNGSGTILLDVRVGGGMLNLNSHPAITDCLFSCNSALKGGGMYNQQSRPAVTDCTFSSNEAHEGGAMFNAYYSGPVVDGCTFENNAADLAGGGMYNASSPYNPDVTSNPVVINSIFNGNQALPSNPMTIAGNGGAIYNSRESVLISNCTFEQNHANLGGGGIWNNSSLTVSGCSFSENSTGIFSQDNNNGGGISNWGNVVLTNSKFFNNTSNGKGGGIYNNGSYGITMIAHNCLLIENISNWGGAMFNQTSTQNIINCTVFGNSAETSGSGIVNFYGDTIVSNCIIWNHAGEDLIDARNHVYDPPNTEVQHSDIDGCGGSGAGWAAYMGIDGGGNIDTDPLFADSNNDDFHLLPWSPCIDAGDPAGDYTGQTDMDGESRVLYDAADMGVDEVFPIAGDIDKDGDVDLTDFGYFAGHWLKGM